MSKKTKEMACTFEIGAGKLAEALKIAKGVVGAKTTLPILGTVRLVVDGNGLEVSASNLDVYYSIRIPLEAPPESRVALCVGAATLSALVGRLDKGKVVTVRLDPSAGLCELTANGNGAKLMGLPEEEWPDAPLCEGPWESAPQVLHSALEGVSYCVSADQSRYVLCGIWLGKLENTVATVATDGRRLAKWEIDGEWPGLPDSGLIVPTLAARELAGLLGRAAEDGDAELAVSGGGAWLHARSARETLSMKLIEGTFPNWRQVVPSPNRPQSKVVRADLLDGLGWVESMAGSGDKLLSVRVSIEGQVMTLRVHSPEVGESEVTVPCSGWSGPGGSWEIALNPLYFHAAIAAYPDAEVVIEGRDGAEPVVLSCGGYLSLIMPMRVS